MAIQTWEQVVEKLGRTAQHQVWEMSLESYHIWIEKTPCGEFPTVIEGADGIYQIASAGREPIGYFLNPLEAEQYARACYGASWQDDGRQLMPYEKTAFYVIEPQ